MRFIIFCLFFFNILQLKAQNSEMAALNIYISDCRDLDSSNFRYLTKIKVLKNGNKFKTIEFKDRQAGVLLDSLGFGIYTLIYKSYFGIQESLNVEISENKEYDLNICVYFMDYSKIKYIPIIDRLKEDDFYVLSVYSSGCFYFSENQFTITRKKNNFILSSGTYEKKLNEIEVDAIRHFEMELNNVKGSGCTSTDKYILEYKNNEFKVVDRACSWRGIYFLKLQLFGDGDSNLIKQNLRKF